MRKLEKSLVLNPFQRIAGVKALLWGVAGIVLTALLCSFTQLHFDGIMHVGIAKEPVSFLVLLSEHLIIWLLLSILFYLTGLVLSKSKIRFIDVLGTFSFAQIPVIFTPLVYFSNSFRQMESAEYLTELMQNPEMMTQTTDFKIAMLLAILIIPALVWQIIWLFQAYKTSCNLKGVKLWLSFIILLLAADIIYKPLFKLLISFN